MSTRKDPLDRLVAETRAETPADVDWERVEGRLLATVAGERATRPAPARRVRTRAWGMFASAAVVALAVGAAWTARGGDVSPAASRARTPVAPPASGEDHRVTEPPAGQQLVADGVAVDVEHPGRATWRLAPGSTARVAEQGRYLTIALDRGALSARVVARGLPESFAVEVEGTRVAVKGTAFRVARATDHVEVEVSEGTVIVGPAGTRGSTEGWELAAPSSQRFGLDGRPVTTAGTGPARGASRVRPIRTPTSAKPTSPDATARVAELADTVAEVTKACFADSTPATEGTRVTAQATVEVELDALGHIVALKFDPPLSPAVRRCVDADLGGASAGAIGAPRSTTRSLSLGE